MPVVNIAMAVNGEFYLYVYPAGKEVDIWDVWHRHVHDPELKLQPRHLPYLLKYMARLSIGLPEAERSLTLLLEEGLGTGDPEWVEIALEAGYRSD